MYGGMITYSSDYVVLQVFVSINLTGCKESKARVESIGGVVSF